MKNTVFAILFAAGPCFASCPAPRDISSELDALIADANAAENETVGRQASAKMWQLWLAAPDGAAQSVLDEGMRARQNYDFLGAVDAFTRLVEYCPDYAEGYNQRAFARFLQQDYASALVDLDLALELSPRHVGAQSGRALTLLNLGRVAEARLQLVEALKNNPWLSERHLLVNGGPLAPSGEDI